MGDCEGFVFRQDGTCSARVSEIHRPTLTKERQRILDGGGWVLYKRVYVLGWGKCKDLREMALLTGLGEQSVEARLKRPDLFVQLAVAAASASPREYGADRLLREFDAA